MHQELARATRPPRPDAAAGLGPPRRRALTGPGWRWVRYVNLPARAPILAAARLLAAAAFRLACLMPEFVRTLWATPSRRPGQGQRSGCQPDLRCR